MGTSKSDLIVREIEEYFFCPRAFYIMVALGQERPIGFWSDLGKEIEEEVANKLQKIFKRVERGRLIENKRLGVVGKIDLIVYEGNSVAPLEIKYSAKVRPWWRYSLVLYAILLEEDIKKPVKHAYLYLTEAKKEKLVKVDIRDADREYVEACVRKCREIVEGFVEPKPMTSKSCENCDYKHICIRYP